MGHNCEYWASRYMDSLWGETSETWEDGHEDWRVVGSNPFKRRLENTQCSSTQKQVLYVIEFPSKRLDIAAANTIKLAKESYVILEADRGEDCGMVKGCTTQAQFEQLLKRQESPHGFRIKQIYRAATPKDLEQVSWHRERVKSALEHCRQQVLALQLSMEIIDCEYQFDLNKITFFYRSSERIDFRDLVKNLYKIFKTRIWMCSVDKSNDKLLSCLIEE